MVEISCNKSKSLPWCLTALQQVRRIELIHCIDLQLYIKSSLHKLLFTSNINIDLLTAPYKESHHNFSIIKPPFNNKVKCDQRFKARGLITAVVIIQNSQGFHHRIEYNTWYQPSQFNINCKTTIIRLVWNITQT